MNYNPYLKPWHGKTPAADAGKRQIEHADEQDNLIWQTRSAPPGEYETQLGDALEAVFRDGIEDLAGIVAGLNRAGIKTASGALWTESSFEQEMRRLGA